MNEEFLCNDLQMSRTPIRDALDTVSPREFVRARTRKLLVPSTVGLFVFHWIQGYVSIRLSHASDMIKEAPVSGAPAWGSWAA